MKPVDAVETVVEVETVAKVKTVDEEEPVGEVESYGKKNRRLSTDEVSQLQAAVLCIRRPVPLACLLLQS